MMQSLPTTCAPPKPRDVLVTSPMPSLSGSNVEAARLLALASYDFSNPKLERELYRISERAVAIGGSVMGGFAFVERDRIRIFAPIGIRPPALPRERSIAEIAIQQDELLGIPNTLEDPRSAN